MREDIALKIDARRDLGEHEALFLQTEYAAFRNKHDLLTKLLCALCGKGELLDLMLELFDASFVNDMQLSVLYLDLKPLCSKRADKVKLGCRLRDTDKPAAARNAGSEFAYVDITLRVSLRKSEKCLIEPAAMIEVK